MSVSVYCPCKPPWPFMSLSVFFPVLVRIFLCPVLSVTVPVGLCPCLFQFVFFPLLARLRPFPCPFVPLSRLVCVPVGMCTCPCLSVSLTLSVCVPVHVYVHVWISPCLFQGTSFATDTVTFNVYYRQKNHRMTFHDFFFFQRTFFSAYNPRMAGNGLRLARNATLSTDQINGSYFLTVTCSYLATIFSNASPGSRS
jgi:hypothetical protein